MARVSGCSSFKHRDDAIHLGHRVGDRADDLLVQLDFGQVDHLHVHLLGQRLAELLVGDQPHVLGDLAQQFAGPLLLLFQQRLQLVVGDEAQIDQNLSDTPDGHRSTLNSLGTTCLNASALPLRLFDAPFGVDDPLGQVVRVVGLGQHVLDRALLLLPQLEQGVVHQLHAVLGPGLDRRTDAEHLVLADQVGDAGGDHQDFVGGTPAAADPRQQRLGQDADDRRGQLRADLVLQVARKGVDDPVDRALGTVGVQRAEHHVARFGRRDRRRDRLQVTHFADQDHVRVLPQGAADGLRETRHVDADLALIDRRFLVVVVELDRILDRDDVVVDVLVDVVHQAGQRRALARTRRPGHQEQPAGPQHQLGHHVRQPQLLRRQHVVGNLPQHHRDLAALLEDRDAEPGLSPKAKPKSVPPFSCSSRWQRSGVMLFINATVSSGSSVLVSSLPQPAVQPKHGRLARA